MRTLAVLLTLCGPAAGGEIISEFLFYRSSFTQTQINALRSYGGKLARQPIYNTDYFTPPNTNYFTLMVSTQRATENTALLNAVASGKGKRISTIEVVTERDGRIGGDITYCIKKELSERPQDWDKGWDTWVSSK